MTHHHRIWRLRTLHRELDRLLRQELRKPQPDAFAMQGLKRRKLQVKDALRLAEAGVAPATAGASVH